MRSRRQLAPLAAAAALLGVGAASCGGSTQPAQGPPSPTPASTSPAAAGAARSPLTSMFEDQTELFRDPSATLDTLRGLGVATVRVYVSWASVAPNAASPSAPGGFAATSPSAYPSSGWAPYDAIDRAAAARGIAVMMTPEGPPPRWAAGPGAPPGTPDDGADWKPSAPAFGAFVRALATRYSGKYAPSGASSPLPRVDQWSIWNEPNYGPQLAPQATEDSTVEVSPALYRDLLNAAWTSLRDTGHARDTILIGELAPRGITGPKYPGNFSGMVPLRFLRALYCVDSALRPLQGPAAAARGCPPSAGESRSFATDNPALFEASGLALHPYPQGRLAPNFVTPGEPDYADLAALPTVESLIDRLAAVYGSHRQLPIYSTEFGYNTDPPYSLGAPMAQAAEYLNWSEYISWRDPRVRTFDQYLLVDPPADSHSRFDTGLEFAGATRKPIYDAWRMPLYLPRTAGSHGVPLDVWGCVRPIAYVSAPRADAAAIQFKPASGRSFKTVKTVKLNRRDCYFDAAIDFPASGTVRIGWSAPGAGRLVSRQVQITLS
jgi:hypothetical protein